MRHEIEQRDRAARSRRAYARDLGLDMVDRANRWLISGAVILAGGVSALTWHAFHAHAAAVTHPAASQGTASQSSGAAQPGDDGTTTPLQAPSQAPTATTAAPASTPAPVSGGS
jgi:hypothetical protein